MNMKSGTTNFVVPLNLYKKKKKINFDLIQTSSLLFYSRPFRQLVTTLTMP